MTPEQIDTVTDGLITVHAFVDTWWPTAAYITCTVALWWALHRTERRIRTRRELRHSIHRIEHYANHPANRTRRDQQRKEDTP